MKIELFFDGLTKRDVPIKPIREASRAIIEDQGKFLVVYSKSLDTYVFPGGGIEMNETKEEAVIREVLEETGYHLNTALHRASVYEYFVDSTWINHYFIATIDRSNQEEQNLTQEEKEAGLEVVWLDEISLLDLFDQYHSSNIYGDQIHEREFIGFINSR